MRLADQKSEQQKGWDHPFAMQPLFRKRDELSGVWVPVFHLERSQDIQTQECRGDNRFTLWYLLHSFFLAFPSLTTCIWYSLQSGMEVSLYSLFYSIALLFL